MFINIILVSLILGGPTWAQNTCEKAKSAMKDIKGLCLELDKKNVVHCAAAAPTKKESIPAITYGVFTASGKMKSLFEKMENLQHAFMKEDGGCPGGCTKINAPVVELVTKPTAVVSDPACPETYTPVKLSAAELQKFGIGQPEVYFKKSFRLRAEEKQCHEEASSFAQSTLMGDNELGKFLEQQKCKSPCSYSSTIRLKTKAIGSGECGVDLELAVHCGPPKKDREWITQATLVKSYRCEVTP